MTKDELAALVFATVESLLNSAENLEEIRLQFQKETENFFEKRA